MLQTLVKAWAPLETICDLIVPALAGKAGRRVGMVEAGLPCRT